MRKLVSAIVAVVLLSSSLFVSTVSAAPYGACVTNGNNHNQSGELYGQGQFYRIAASVEVGGSNAFAPCSPNDQLGQNISAGQIGLKNGSGAFVTLGIAICNWDNAGSFPPSICNGGRHFYAEQHGLAVWDYTMYQLGSATNGVAHDLVIEYGTCQSGRYCFYVDGVLKLNLDMGLGLHPTDWQTASFQAETSDNGDGLGTVSNAVNIGQMQEYFNAAWHNHAVGSGCDVISSQHRCVPNGTYGFYAYTVN